MSTVTCPECEAQIGLDAGTEAGEIIVCSDCGVDLGGLHSGTLRLSNYYF